MSYIRKHYLLVRSAGGLSHTTIEKRAEMFGASCQIGTCCIHRLVLHQKGNICKHRIVDELPKVINEVARGYRNGLEAELVEIIQHDAAIVPTEHIERVVQHLSH